MNERSQKIRLGLFTFGALIAVAVLIIMFGKKPAWFTTRQEYQVEFTNAPGIGAGTPVRRSGVKIGEVTGLELTDTGEVRVSLLVDKRFLPRSNETASIAQALLTGDSTIDFVMLDREQKLSPDPLPSDKPIKGRSPIDTRSAAEDAKEIIPAVKDSLDQIRTSFERFTKVAPQIENTLAEYAMLAKAARETVPELQRTNDSVRRLADETRLAIPEIKQTNDEVKLAVKNWSNAGEQVNVLIMTNRDKVGKTLDQLATAIERATGTLDRVNKLLNDENQRNFTDTLKNIREASESVGQFAKNGEQIFRDGSKAMQRINDSVAKAEAIIDNLQKATKPLAERSDAITRNIETTTGDLNKLVLEFRYLLQTYGNSNGTVQKLLTDPTLFNNLNYSIIMVNNLMPKLERILANVETFSDKIGRHPEVLGLSGIFRPSGGLKGAPNAPYWLQER